MSAFIVSNKTMQGAVEAVLIAEADTWKDHQEFSRQQVYELGHQLYALNEAAVAHRYPGDNEMLGGEAFEAEGFSFGRRDLEKIEPMVQRYKALQCLLYQCSEGDVPEHELFKRAEKATAGLACEIVLALPAYEKARWGA